MKRLIFCFDGSWNRLSGPIPTNVVLTAESITPVAQDGVTQIIHYDPGVGTGEDDKWKGGLFGEGLIDKIADGYTFLAFNYEPGDEVFVFGFSRGAFTARAFVGLIRQVGIVQRKHASKISDAIDLYKARKPGESHDAVQYLNFRASYSPQLCIDQDEDAWRVQNCPGYATGSASVLRIKYVGVWDTVAAVGMPSDLFIAPFANRHEQYFDSDLSPLVVSARHAVAIDEQRTTFIPTLWPNFRELNASLGFHNGAADAPYQQKWFPGHHGSVGGGYVDRGLSDGALVWILDGALRMGLVVDRDPESPLFAVCPDDLGPLEDPQPAHPSVLERVEGALLRHAPREHGPTTLEEVSDSAIRRWREPAANLPERKPYRPLPLQSVAAAIDAAAGPPRPQAEHPNAIAVESKPVAGQLYKIVYGDELRKLALLLYGHADCAKAIVEANPTITNPDRIFIGQIIYLPTAETARSTLSDGV